MRDQELKLRHIVIQPFDKVWKFVLANVLVALFVITFFFGSAYNSLMAFTISIVWSLSISFTQWVGHVLINHYIQKRIPILENPTKHTVLSIVFMSCYAMIAYVGVQLLMHLLIYGQLPDSVVSALLKSAYVPAAIAMSISLLFSARGYFFQWRKSVLEVEKLKTEMLSYKYESLRSQINPHFLFNSFNVLSDLIYSDQKLAVDFVQKMSGLFRYVLDSRDKELVPLSEELDFISDYFDLLKTRFEDKISLKLEINAETDELIVPMSLQLLIENAVKHNEVSQAKPLAINLYKESSYIVVENNLQLKKVGDQTKKLGLKNIEQQFVYFTDDAIQVIRDDKSFMVKLPILKAEQS